MNEHRKRRLYIDVISTVIVVTAVFALLGPADAQTFSSLYTSTAAKDCRLRNTGPDGSSERGRATELAKCQQPLGPSFLAISQHHAGLTGTVERRLLGVKRPFQAGSDVCRNIPQAK